MINRRMMMGEQKEEDWDYVLLPNEEGKIPALQLDLRTFGIRIGESISFHVKYHSNATANAFSQCVYSVSGTNVANPQQIGTTAGIHTFDITVTRQDIYLGYVIVFSGYYSYSTGMTDRSVQGDYVKIRIIRDTNWDYIWEPSHGLLTDNGWTVVGTPTGSETITNDGLVLSGQIELKAPVNTMNTGVMEINFIAPTQTSFNFYAGISNGTNGAKFGMDRQYWRKCNKPSSEYYNMDVLLNQQPGNGMHTVRLEMGTSTSDYYVDGALCADDYSNTSIVDCTYNMLGYYLANQSATILGIRFMINRLS